MQIKPTENDEDYEFNIEESEPSHIQNEEPIRPVGGNQITYLTFVQSLAEQNEFRKQKVSMKEEFNQYKQKQQAAQDA